MPVRGAPPNIVFVIVILSVVIVNEYGRFFLYGVRDNDDII